MTNQQIQTCFLKCCRCVFAFTEHSAGFRSYSASAAAYCRR